MTRPSLLDSVFALLFAPVCLMCLVCLACVNKSDIPDPGCPGAPSCATTGDVAGDSTGADASADASSGATATAASSSATTTATTTNATTATSEGSSGSTGDAASSTDADASSTGAPPDNTYAPCQADDECTTGVCYAGFCTIVCWTQLDGEIECPPPPGDAIGVTVTCDRIGTPKGPGCKGCFDCGQYCIPSCTADSTCPGGGACIDAACSPGGTHCG